MKTTVLTPVWVIAGLAATGLLGGLAAWRFNSGAPAPIALQEPATPYSTGAIGPWGAKLFEIARRDAAQGDLSAAIEAMQMATNTMARQRNTSFELWDDLAELYCLQADRERDRKRAAAARANGLALLRESRCAAKFYDAQTPQACFMGDTAIPNTDMTPLCYTVMCTNGIGPASAQLGYDLSSTVHRQVAIERLAGMRPPAEPDEADDAPPKDDLTQAEREVQTRRFGQDAAARGAAESSYRQHYREDAANLDRIDALCKGAN